MTAALNRNACRSAFFKLVHLRLGPKMGALGDGWNGCGHCDSRKRSQKRALS
jgi:hypothetical protein